MNAKPLIVAQNVSKLFGRSDHLSKMMLARELAALFLGRRPVRQNTDENSFLALDDASFTVARGEALGVIGHNGAGKTTLLRLLAGEYQPDAGNLTVDGRKSTLVDLTSGFALQMTGRENIYFRGAHLGFTHEYLRRVEQAIIDFAEIDEFIDAEIKTYSSGMMLRLGFAVSVFVQPDVLLVDEILAVGDFLFAAKCMRKLNEIKSRAAIVYVSHSMELIVQFTDKVLVLDRGRPVFLGSPAKAVDAYHRLEKKKAQLGESRLSRRIVHAESPVDAPAEPSEAASADTTACIGEQPRAELRAERNHEGDTASRAPVIDISEVPGPAQSVQSPARHEGFAAGPVLRAAMGDFIETPGAITRVEALWCRSDGTPTAGFAPGQPVALAIRFRPLRQIARLVIGVPVWTEDGKLVSAFGTQARANFDPVVADQDQQILLQIPALPLSKGTYPSVVAILDGAEYLFRRPIDPLTVLANSASLQWGIVAVDYHWSVKTAASE